MSPARPFRSTVGLLAVLACAGPDSEVQSLFLSDTTAYFGYYVAGHEVRAFYACNGSDAQWVMDSTGGVLGEAFDELSDPVPYDSIFIAVRGRVSNTVDDGFAGDYPSALVVTELRRAEGEGFGCDDSSQGVFKAFGNEPFWGLEASPDTLRFIRLGEQPLTFAVNQIALAKGGWVLTGSKAGTGSERIRVEVNEKQCVDGMSGSRFSYVVQADLEVEAYVGCGRRPL